MPAGIPTEPVSGAPWRPERLWRPLLVAFVALIALFTVWELVERAWMRETVGAETLHQLHLVRGFASSLLVGGIFAWHLFRNLVVEGAVQGDTADDSLWTSARVDNPSRQQARWLIDLRWLVCVAGLTGLLAIVGLEEESGYQQAAPPLLACFGLLAASNLIYALSLRANLRLGRQLAVQMAFDLVLLTTILHFVGSIDSPLVGLYVLHLILANVLLGRRAAVGITMLAIALVLVLVLLESTGTLAHQGLPERHTVTTEHPPAEWLTWTTGVLLTLVGTAYLSAAAAHRLRDQRRRLDEALRAASGERAKLERVLDAAGAGLILLDDKKRILWASQGFLDMSPEEENLDLLCRQCPQCAAMQALNEGRTVSTDFSRTEADGVRRYYRATASPLRSGDEELGRVVEVIQDVTASKAMEQEVIRTGKLAATGRLAAVIAHEVGNPLASLEARLSLMERSDDPGFARKSAPILRDQLARIERIVHGLSKFARPNQATVTDTGIDDVIREVVDFLRFEPRARSVQIECEVPADLPRVRPSRDELSQVFLNLALNGIQAVGRNGTVRFEGRDENGQIVVTVTDDGPGVRPEVAPHIFEPFYSSKEHGVGLGLVISRSIIETHGGTLRFDEQHRPGARFIVTLPRVNASAESSA